MIHGKSRMALMAMTAALCLAPLGAEEARNPAMPVFPELDGFSKTGEPMRFDPDTLFEYVNGDAFNYQGFHFDALAVQEYEGPEQKTLIAEVYRHGSANDGFGIYSYERPSAGRFLAIGGEGYYEGGTLNFFKDRYYVKLSGTGLEEAGETLLSALARAIAATIEGPGGLPATAAGFPEKDLVAHSVRYVASHFLGHAFLHSAFVAEYELAGARTRAFILEGADDAEAERMIRDYLALVKKKGGVHEAREGRYRFSDPYRSPEGKVNLRRAGRRVLGVFHDDPEVAGGLLNAIEAELPGPE